VSFIFKGFAILSALAGFALVLYLHSNAVTTPPSVAVYASITGGTLFAVATLLFFAYVLELLADIYDNSEILAQIAIGDDDGDQL
jgi:hypothetical protein